MKEQQKETVSGDYVIERNPITRCKSSIPHNLQSSHLLISFIVMYCITLCCVVMYCIVMYCITLCCVVMYCIVL